MKKLLLTLALLPSFWVQGQILHTETFNVILDTSVHIKGNLLPEFNFQNLKEDLVEFENTADLSLRYGRNAVTFANKVSLSKFGNETFQSGGFIYAEYRRIGANPKLAVEPYSQIHWAEVRGLDFKYAGGINFRARLITNKKTGLFVGVGPFYELERWNYDGVSEEKLPSNTQIVETELLKIGAYLSFKQEVLEKIFIDLSLYYQNRLNALGEPARFGTSSRISFGLTKYIDFIIQYQSIYDPNPVVPIDKLFNDITIGVSISF